MKLHYLQHEPVEDLANIEPWARARGFTITGTRLYDGESLPETLDGIDWLVIMGGAMNIYQHDAHPWLVDEKKFIRSAIDANKVVVGVCLGAQLIADVLGAPVTKNNHTEIGWFPVSLTDEGKKSPLFNGIPDTFISFHWHGDIFAIPDGEIH